MPDVVFFLKAAPPAGVFPASTKLVGLDPVAAGFGCEGADAYCSTAYSKLYSSLKGADGRALPNLLKKYKVEGASRVAFVSFSAGHGFMNPFLANDADRAGTSAVLLLDSTFGGGKTGYVDAAKDAVANRLLLATATSDKQSKDALTNGDYAWREYVLKPADLSPPATTPRAPMPKPDEGAFQQGSLIYYRYSHNDIPHTSMGKIVLKPLIQATLLPYWAGSLATPGAGAPPWVKGVIGALAFVAGLWAIKRVSEQRGARRDNPEDDVESEFYENDEEEDEGGDG